MINVSLSTIKKLAVILTFLLTSCSSQSPLPALSENRTVQSLPINIKQGMPYLEARGILIKDGWQIITMHTTPNGTPSCWMSDWDETKSPKISCDYAEVDSCSGTGMGGLVQPVVQPTGIVAESPEFTGISRVGLKLGVQEVVGSNPAGPTCDPRGRQEVVRGGFSFQARPSAPRRSARN